MNNFLERLRGFVRRLKKLPKTQRNLYIFVATFLALSFPLAPTAALINGTVKGDFFSKWILVFVTLPGFVLTAFCSAVIMLLVRFFLVQNNELHATESESEDGILYSKSNTYGSARWMTRKEACEVYDVCPVEKCNGIILGKFTEGKAEIANTISYLLNDSDDASCDNDVIALRYSPKANQNVLLIGPPGSGKSWGYVRTAVFQSILREESVVVTDPKGEIHNDMRKILESRGYRVKVFNLEDLRKSDAWNIASEIYDPHTGDINELRVIVLCDTIIRNTSINGKVDEFWGTGEQNLLKVAVLYTAFVRELYFTKAYERAAKEFATMVDYVSQADLDHLCDAIIDPETTMNEREEIVRTLGNAALDDVSAVESKIEDIKLKAPSCTIADMYYSLLHNDLSAWESNFQKVPLSHPAASAWALFQKCGERVQPGFLTGLGQRLQLFQMRDVRRIVCNDDINLGEIGKYKTALFLIISDDNASMQTLSSLLFSFLFKDLKEEYDRVGGKGRISVNVIADEMANTGVWPQFEKTISTARSRQIYISMILQSLPQLTLLYGKDIAETIIGCCNTILVLGCNDDTSAKYISNLSGVATIRAKSIKDDRLFHGNRPLGQDYSISEGDGKRNLANPDDVRGLKPDEVLIYSNGHHMLKAHRFAYTEHPYSSDPYFIPTMWDELPDARDKYRATEVKDAFSVGDLTRMNETNRSIADRNMADTRAPRPIKDDSRDNKTPRRESEPRAASKEGKTARNENAFKKADGPQQQTFF